MPSIEYVGKPPPDVYPVTGFYPEQSAELIAELAARIDHLISNTDLTATPNRTCLAYDKKMTLHRNYQEPLVQKKSPMLLKLLFVI